MTPKEAISIWKDMFSDKESTFYRNRSFALTLFQRRLKAFDIYVENVGIVRCIEQNTAKANKWAKKHINGQCIMWLIPPNGGSWWRVEGEAVGKPDVFGILPARRVSYYKGRDERSVYTEVLED